MTSATLPVGDRTERQSGLSSEQARQRLLEYGWNDPTPRRRRSVWARFFVLFLNPLAALLLIAAMFSAFLGQLVDASIIVFVVVLGSVLNFVQTYRSERAVDALRQRVRTTASVLRDSTWQEVSRNEIVPGDVVRLFAGDLVPADALLIESKDLFVQQAALTGESLPVEKQVLADAKPTDEPDAPYMVFLGTSVVSGSALALVSATGLHTVFGGIASRLADRPQETEFERSLRKFGLLIMRVVLFLVVFLITVSIAFHHDAFESVLFAIALAVGLTPEFLPMITSVTLAKGAVEMAKSKVIVKRLPAIQNLGSIDVLCSDKTGTLTVGVMKLSRAIDPVGVESDRVLLLGRLNSQFETGIRNPLNTAILERGGQDSEGYTKCGEVPFDFERRCVSIAVESNKDHSRLLITKGAPESVLEKCGFYMCAGENKPLDDEMRTKSLEKFHELSSNGLRVLAVAFRAVPKQEGYSRENECELVLAGYLAFEDPIRRDVAATVAALRQDGVRLKIVTGDNELVTKHVCQQVGLDASDVVLGDQLAQMTDSALDHVVEQTSVFARVSPAQKNRILLALKRRSHVVGYLGDGINDAPSLHVADVGISVDTAADVARDAADMILVESGLGVLHAGILQGRRASGNVLKYLLMGTSSNFGNMLSMAGASLFLPFLPMLPTQILLNNFLYDVSQVTIPTDAVDEEYLRKPQRWNISLIQRFMLLIGPISSIYDFLTFFVLLRWFHAGQPEFHTGWFVESLATQTLVLFVIRTFRNPLKSRPSNPLSVTVIAIVAVGVVLPFSPLGRVFGFTPLPLMFFMFLIAVTTTYLAMVEFAKQRLFHQVSQTPANISAALPSSGRLKTRDVERGS